MKRSKTPEGSSSDRNSETKVIARELLVRYGTTIALDRFSTNISEGITGLLGPNGAGKTTFIKTLLGRIRPEKGNIKFRDEESDMRSVEMNEKIGYMPESECLINDMKGFELVSYFGRLSGLVEEDALQRSHKILDFVGLDEERYRKISSYSTGMKQRVKLAQAIVHDPEVMLLDEPTNGMDPDGKKEMLDLIENIGRSDKTILLSSHILHEVEQVSDRVIMIDEGKKVTSGPIGKLMGSEKGRYKLKVRGVEDDLNDFEKELVNHFEVVKTRREKNQVTAVIKGLEGSNEIFKMAGKNDLQLRYLRPDLMSLEDFFLESFSGGDSDGS